MSSTAPCLVCSASADWVARLRAHLADLTALQHVGAPAELDAALERQPASLLLLDLLTAGAADRLPFILKTWPQTVVVAFGPARTDPALEAEQLGVYAVDDAGLDRVRLAALVRRALDYLALARENRLLRAEAVRLNAIAEVSAARAGSDAGPSLNLRDLSSALRHFTDVETLLHRLTDEVSHALGVARVGIFCRTRGSGAFSLRAGLRCLDTSGADNVDDRHPLVRWFRVHTHVISRANLEHVRDPAARLLLTQTLDQLGAEALAPLQSRERLLGWLFVGSLATGFPFENAHIENLIAITDCVSTTLENALLYEEVAIQKTLAETLLHSMPTGIVAVDADGVVRWYNDSARALLGMPAEAALAHPVEVLGSRIADALRRTLGERGAAQALEWTDNASRHSFTVSTRRLANDLHCLGAVAVLQDTTAQKAIEEQQERLDRAAFWAELAASMSHEVRNPLVAIKTFAQLLPERYNDPEFQQEFRELVSTEVDRLNSIVDQINDFAHPPPINLRPLPVRPCVERSIAAVVPPNTVTTTVSAPDRLPEVAGDEQALGAAFGHILRNAVEALAGRTGAEISVALRALVATDGKRMVEILFKDNGPGVAPDLADKLFSPFCTSKARGLGFGLPIVKRTISDHGGRIAVHSNTLGTCVSLLLPALPADFQAP